ncbi:hypothetical protein ACP4OV_012605 [Aristida adscensionis]
MDAGESSTGSTRGRGRSRRRPAHILVPQPDPASVAQTRRRRRLLMDPNSNRGCTASLDKPQDPKTADNHSDSLISIDGVLLDENGSMAQINIPKNLEKQFRPLLAEGSVYIFSDVTAADRRYKTYIYHHQSYILQFKSTTKVHRLESRGSTIPEFSFSFCLFDQLSSKSLQSKPLIDLDEQTQEIVLWGEYGESFDEALVFEKSEHEKVIAIFAGLTARSYSGKTEASSTSATIIHIDLDSPEVVKYRTSFLMLCKYLQLKPQANYMTLTTYHNCQYHHSRYKLPLTITDKSKSIDAIAFSSVAQDLVEYTASQASQNMKIAADDHVAALDNAIGKTRLFSINYVIKRSFPIDDQAPTLKGIQIKDPSPAITAAITTNPQSKQNDSTSDRSQAFDAQSSTNEISTCSTEPTNRLEPPTKCLKEAYVDEHSAANV